ncbi:MAG: sigma-70 family RNA polymerase sigma factor [Lacipirellulaceae bacterium]
MDNSTCDSGVNDEFIRNLTSCQNRLYVYILSLMPDPEGARDLLQETNLVLWRKAKDFQPGTSFEAWACKIAYYEVLTERRKRGRDRHMFSEAVVSLLASEAEPKLAQLDERSLALDECLGQLHPRQRQQLLERYSPGGSVKALAEATGTTQGAVATTLYRIRNLLSDCIKSKLSRGTV